MSKNRKIGITIWLIAFALSVLMILIIPSHYTAVTYTALVFDMFANISSLVVWLSILKNAKTAQNIFYYSPTMIVTTAYLVIQLILSIVCGFFVDTMPLKLVVVLNIVLAAVAWILILSTTALRAHAQRVDSRQKNYHVEL